MSEALPYTGQTRISRLLGVKNYLNNYLAMCTLSDLLPYTRESRIARLLEVINYLNNYFAIYTCLTRFRIRVELASPAWGLRII